MDGSISSFNLFNSPTHLHWEMNWVRWQKTLWTSSEKAMEKIYIQPNTRIRGRWITAVVDPTFHLTPNCPQWTGLDRKRHRHRHGGRRKKSQTCSRNAFIFFPVIFKLFFASGENGKKWLKMTSSQKQLPSTVRPPLDFNGVLCFSFEIVRGSITARAATESQRMLKEPSYYLVKMAQLSRTSRICRRRMGLYSIQYLAPETQLFLIKTEGRNLHPCLRHHNDICWSNQSPNRHA